METICTLSYTRYVDTRRKCHRVVKNLRPLAFQSGRWQNVCRESRKSFLTACVAFFLLLLFLSGNFFCTALFGFSFFWFNNEFPAVLPMGDFRRFCGYHNYRIPCYTQLQRVDFIHFHILNYRRPCYSQLQCVDFIHFHTLNYRRPCYSQLQHVDFIHFHIPNYRLYRVDFILRPGIVNAEMKVPSKVFSCR